ncbi:hypothetical protein C3L33_03936, partial [Rhododendron williamsianum]
MLAEDMPQRKSVPEEFAYGQMIDSLCKVGRHNGAAQVAYIMKTKGFISSFVSYNSIVHGLRKEGSCMRSYQLLEEGIEFGYWPSEYTYIVLIEGLCLEADLCKAKEVFQIMLKKEGLVIPDRALPRISCTGAYLLQVMDRLVLSTTR